MDYRGAKTQENGRRMCAELLHETKSQQTCHSSNFYTKKIYKSLSFWTCLYRIKKKCIRLHTGIYKETQRNVKKLYTGFTSLKISEIQTIYGELFKFLIQIPLFKLCPYLAT